VVTRWSLSSASSVEELKTPGSTGGAGRRGRADFDNVRRSLTNKGGSSCSSGHFIFIDLKLKKELKGFVY
jgi:hypothetical protein